MGFWQPLTHLRYYISQNPPGVAFFLCLLILAVSFIGLSSYVHTHPQPNPDSTKDWNHLLSSLSQLKLCMKANFSSAEPVASPLTEQEMGKMSSVNSTKGSPPVSHLHVKVPLVVTYTSASHTLKGLGLHTSLVASQLGLAGNKTLNLTLQLLSEWKGNNFTCLSISAPAYLLPPTPIPPECPVSEKIISPIHVASVETRNYLPPASHTCYSLQSKHDPTLTVMLTQEQRDMAGRHLLEVSAFLLGLCLIFCLSLGLTYSSTRRYHGNGLDMHCEPLIDS
ncbi:transmembrane protein 248 [Lampris incognitus]|uniref:transmembrane protein 248 n=1 Tax=Lampris incognitus TaxID=2546036 RepID=UPI0024B5BA2A|nr:transmembrane protein 248 [Lampris incognitus]XP_056131227.1 transmembrane protein 248 [Lampris incognitus]